VLHRQAIPQLPARKIDHDRALIAKRYRFFIPVFSFGIATEEQCPTCIRRILLLDSAREGALEILQFASLNGLSIFLTWSRVN
jgi:hypothetical protein